jgi:hypothetical protein
MKLSETTLSVLNNFKNLNDSLLFYPGNEIKSLSTDKSVYMTATIQDEIPQKFAIFSVREFLQVLTVVKDADIDFKEDHMFISNGHNSVVFRYANEAIVDDVYQKKIVLGDSAFDVNLPVSEIKNMFKMAGYLGIYDVNVQSGDQGRLVLHDKKASHNHSFTINLETPIESNGVSFNISMLSMLDIGYKLSYFPAKNMVRFSGIEFPVNYHVSCQS